MDIQMFAVRAVCAATLAISVIGKAQAGPADFSSRDSGLESGEDLNLRFVRQVLGASLRADTGIKAQRRALAASKGRSRPSSSNLAGAQVECRFPWKDLPSGTRVFAGSAVSNGIDAGFPIDKSGFNAKYRDVVVDQPGVDVALLLSMTGANIWRISWTPGTRIVAVWASGDAPQAVVGIPRSTPLLMTSNVSRSPCGHFEFVGDRLDGAKEVAFKAFGRELARHFTAEGDRTVIGAAYVRKDARVLTSPDLQARSYESTEGYAYGRAAMRKLVRDGYLRQAVRHEFLAWKNGWRQVNGLPPAEPHPYPNVVLDDFYVMLRPFEFPKGLFGSNLIELIVPPGMAAPTGDPGHSVIYFMDAFTCQGFSCRKLEDESRSPLARVDAHRGAAAVSSPASSEAKSGVELEQVSDLWIRETGKWYFEVSYDVGVIARTMTSDEAYVMIGCITDRQPRGFVGKIQWEHKQRPSRHIGIAVDFDKRLIAPRVNGEWTDGDPALDQGFPFPRDETTLCGVMATERIRYILRRRDVMNINWGQKPFRFLPPAGFKPYGQGLIF